MGGCKQCPEYGYTIDSRAEGAALRTQRGGALQFRPSECGRLQPFCVPVSGRETPLQRGRGVGSWIVYWCVAKLQGKLGFEDSHASLCDGSG